MPLDYASYIAGLFDGEGYFAVTISPKKRKKKKTGEEYYSVVVYQRAQISMTKEDAKTLFVELKKWLSTQGIRANVFSNGQSHFRNGNKNHQYYTLRIESLPSIIKLCVLLNGKLRMKQALLESFELIARMRQETGNSLWYWDERHFPQYKNLQEAYEWFEQIAIIWDDVRENEYEPKHSKKINYDLRAKLQGIWNKKLGLTSSVDGMAPEFLQ